MKASGLGDTAYFGPEPEFFVFDSVRWGNDMSGCFSKIDSEEAAWNTGKEYEHGNTGHRPDRQGRLFPGAPDRQLPGHALGNVSGARRPSAFRSKSITMKWPMPARWNWAPSSAR